MKLKRKIVLIILLTFIFILVAGTFNTISARTENKWFGLELYRESGNGYIVNEKNVWEICSYGTGTTPSAVADHSETIYCLRAGIGFGSENWGNSVTEKKLYTSSFDMKQEKIPEEYLTVLPEGENYKKMLWILDNAYVAPKTQQEEQAATEYKKQLLAKAGIPESEIKLTDEDIDAAQQLAIWYFTNPNSEYQVGDTFIFYIQNEDGRFALNGKIGGEYIFENGQERHQQANKLVRYLIDNANAQAALSPSMNSTIKPLEIEKTNPTVNVENNKYVIGPYKIKQNINCEYTYDVTFTDGNGNEIENYTILDSSNTTLSNIEVNKEFYISVPMSTNVNEFKMKINFSYFGTDIRYWVVTNAVASNQPIAIVDRKKIEAEDEITTSYTKPQFDLALRKFITKVNEVELTGDDSRIPQVDTTPLISESSTTAIYKHGKNPVIVKTGDIVTYTIRIYNEGKADGYVAMVEDVLPAGLALVANSQINTDNGWEVLKTGDGKTYVGTNKLANQLISAFNGEELDYKDLEIECEVTMTAGNENIVLKNIAEITSDSNIYQEKDRDSEPGNVDLSTYGTTSQEDDDDFEQLVIKPIEVKPEFDLALRKFIIQINGVDLETLGLENREPQVDVSPLIHNRKTLNTTAIYNHPKTSVKVKKGDIVTYTIRVYNEGEMAGYATKVEDILPAGLKLAENSTINEKYGWKAVKHEYIEGATVVHTTYLQDTEIEAFNGEELDYKDLIIECVVTATPGTEEEIVIRNVAEIAADNNALDMEDRDSEPGNLTVETFNEEEHEDDEDFEKLVIEPVLKTEFDLALRKFVTSVNGVELKDENDNYLRAPIVDITKLLNGTAKTAVYNHSKTPVAVDLGDEVIYTIRVYNEGEEDGYVTEITDHIPEQLEFIIDDELNASYGWQVSNDGRTVKTDITSLNTQYSANRDLIYEDRKPGNDKVKLDKLSTNGIDYIDVQIKCKVKENSDIYKKITNIAEVTGYVDLNGNTSSDRDSTAYVVLPTDETLPNYKDDEINNGDEYIPGQEDDDDFEKLVLQRFDLALRKFITGVNDEEVTERIPIFTKNADGTHTYEHPKTPVGVVNGDLVTYTLRIYNEGNQAGYAETVKDDIPEGLEYLPENELNISYRWKMYKEDGELATNVEEAKYIETDYLSKEQEKTEGENLIQAYNPSTMTQPDYKDVKVVFKVKEPNTSDRIIINTAEISDDSDEYGNPVDDVDSIPNNNKPEEDDIDVEKIKVKYFDLALKKWVTSSITIYDGKTTIVKTGHTGDEDPEPVVKVDIKESRLKDTIVKFTYNIKVTNEGEIAGYVKEISDYIPEGLKFVKEDNPEWEEVDGKVVTTQLENTLLQPGESAIVEITLTWINDKNNLGLKVNVAEISKDYNDSNTPDIDSTPNNKVEGEDDQDDAPVILSLQTGVTGQYIVLTMSILIIIATGVILIKKYVI